MWICANDERIRYTGRIDCRVEAEPVWVFPGSSAEFWFSGEVLRIHVENFNEYWQNYLGCILDQVQSAFYLKKSGETVIEVRVPENESGVHHVLFFKRQDGCHELKILGFEIGDGERLIELPPVSERRIEVYGDSVSAGESVEAIDFIGKTDMEHEGGFSNCWFSFPWMTARMLGARLHDIAQGGIALMDGHGWFHRPEQTGMETAWDKIHYNTMLGEMTEWDFSKFVPQVVIVALGQNDNYPVDYMKVEAEKKAQGVCVHEQEPDQEQVTQVEKSYSYCCEMADRWRSHYGDFLKKLRGVYPEAWIVCCTTVLQHDKSWDDAIDRVVNSVKDEKISHFLFSRNGVATPGHPRIPEQFEMAQEIADYIENVLGVYKNK